MTHSSTSVFSSLGSTFLGRTALRILQHVIVFVRALKHRAEIKQLADFDDRMLEDIGLTRDKISGALAETIFENPSVRLVRSVERQSRSQRTADPLRSERPAVLSVGAAGRA